MLGLPSRASCWAITAETAALTAVILNRRVELGQRCELDPDFLERVPDRACDVRGIRCISVHADALDLELELLSFDGDHLALSDEAHGPLAHLLRIAEPFHALEDELPGCVVVEVDVALRHERNAGVRC